jgi:rhodanese-related sulfurtransferase
VLRLWLSFRQLGEARLSEISRVVETYLKDRKALEGVTIEELTDRLRKRDVVVLDVRPEKEYRAGHIAGARSIPITELEKRLKELPKRRAVVAYCRGPYCVFADEAVALLRERGYEAFRLQTGFPDWKMQGLPVETAAEGAF